MHYHSRRRHLSFIPLAVAGCAFIALAALVIAQNQPEPEAPPAQEAHGPVTLFENVRIFDGKSDTLSEPSHVLVRGNVIESISTDPIPVDRRADTTIIHGGGRTLMPGLIDAHVHTMMESIPMVMATSNNAELLALSGRRNPYPGTLGVVEQGALADLLLVDGDPLENLELVADPDGSFMVIMKDGVIHKNTLE